MILDLDSIVKFLEKSINDIFCTLLYFTRYRIHEGTSDVFLTFICQIFINNVLLKYNVKYNTLLSLVL